MTGPADPDNRYTVLPRDLRRERRAGASLNEIQIARARAYIARLEAELSPDAPGLAAPDRERKHCTLRQWRAHLANLHADAADTSPFHHAAE